MSIIMTQQTWVIVSYPPVEECNPDNSPLGTLGLYKTSFNPSCVANSDAAAASTFAALEKVEGPTTDFWPLFSTQTGFNGITQEPFVSCDVSFTEGGQVQNDLDAYARTKIVDAFVSVDEGLSGNYDELSTELRKYMALIDNVLPSTLWNTLLDTGLQGLFSEETKVSVTTLFDAHRLIEGILNSGAEKIPFIGNSLTYDTLTGPITTSNWALIEVALESALADLLVSGNYPNVLSLLSGFNLDEGFVLCADNEELRNKVSCGADVECCESTLTRAFTAVQLVNPTALSQCGGDAAYADCIVDGILNLPNMTENPNAYKNVSLQELPLWIGHLRSLSVGDAEKQKRLTFVKALIETCLANSKTTAEECASLYSSMPENLVESNWSLSPLLVAVNTLAGAELFVGNESAWEVVLILPQILPLFGDALPLTPETVQLIPLLIQTIQERCIDNGIVSIPSCTNNLLGIQAEQNAVPSDFNSEFKLCVALPLKYGINDDCSSFLEFLTLIATKSVKPTVCEAFSDCDTKVAECNFETNKCQSKLLPFMVLVSVCSADSATTRAECIEVATKKIGKRQVLEAFLGTYETTEDLIAACEDDNEDRKRIQLAQAVVPVALISFITGLLLTIIYVLIPKRKFAYAASAITFVGVVFLLVGLLAVKTAPVYGQVGGDPINGETYYQSGSANSMAYICIMAPIASLSMNLYAGCKTKAPEKLLISKNPEFDF